MCPVHERKQVRDASLFSPLVSDHASTTALTTLHGSDSDVTDDSLKLSLLPMFCYIFLGNLRHWVFLSDR